jgi:hypothetical protein
MDHDNLTLTLAGVAPIVVWASFVVWFTRTRPLPDDTMRAAALNIRHALYLELGIDQELWSKVDRQLGTQPVAESAHLVIEQVLEAHEQVLAR